MRVEMQQVKRLLTADGRKEARIVNILGSDKKSVIMDGVALPIQCNMLEWKAFVRRVKAVDDIIAPKRRFCIKGQMVKNPGMFKKVLEFGEKEGVVSCQTVSDRLGYDARTAGVTLAKMASNGRFKRVGRGVYKFVGYAITKGD